MSDVTTIVVVAPYRQLSTRMKLDLKKQTSYQKIIFNVSRLIWKNTVSAMSIGDLKAVNSMESSLLSLVLDGEHLKVLYIVFSF